MRKIFIALMCVIALCGTSAADIAYTTKDGKLGLIHFESSTSSDLEGIQYEMDSENPILGAYWDKGQSRLLMVASNESGDAKVVRLASSNLSDALDSEPVTLTGINNVTNILSTKTGEGVILVYDSSIQEFRTDDLTPTSRNYTYLSSEDVEIKDAAIIGVGVYILVDDSLLMFDGQLSESSKNYSRWTLSEDAEVMTVISGNSLVIGHKKGIQVLSSTLSNLLETSAPVKAICSDSGSGFYYVTQSLSNDIYQNTLCHYANGITDKISTFEGELVKLLRVSSNVLAIIAGDKILLYNTADDIYIAEYNSSELGGIPFRLSTNTSSGYTKKSSGSCNISSFGMLLLISVFCFAIINHNHNSILESR